MENDNFQMIGDARDIPLALGLVTISWNRLESHLRGMTQDLAGRCDLASRMTVEVIVTELGTVGITQALQTYARQFPDNHADLGDSLRAGVEWAERLKSYRNYYIHAIQSITMYGMIPAEEMIVSDAPIHEAMTVGPYGMIYQKSAKGKSKWSQDFITSEKIIWLNNQLIQCLEYLKAIDWSINRYFHVLDWRKIAPLLPQPTLPDVLQKPDLLPLLHHLPPLLRRDEDLIARLEAKHEANDDR